MKKLIFIFILALLGLATNFGCKGKYGKAETDYGEPPVNIEALFREYAREIIAHNPEKATEMGISEEMGYKVAKDRLTDESADAMAQFYYIAAKYRHWLNKFDRTTLTESQRLAADILSMSLDLDLAGEKFKYHKYVIDPINGFHNSLISLMTQFHKIENKEDAENYIRRLEEFPDKLAKLDEKMKIQEDRGIFPSKYIVKITADLLSEFVNTDPKENPLYTSFTERVGKLHDPGKEAKEELYKAVENNIKDRIYTAYNKIISHMRKVQEKTNDSDGVRKLPDGEEYYQYCLKVHTSTDMTADEIHELGKKEVKRVQDEMLRLFDELGFTRRETFGEIVEEYRNSFHEADEKFHYGNTEEAKDQILADYRKIIDEAWGGVSDLFSIRPETLVKVKPVPEFKACTVGAHYEPASLDGRREGVFYANLHSPPFKPEMKTLTYHEAMPGHHFQMSIQNENSETRMFRKLLFFTAYLEGWALYAEKLAKEQGWFEGPYELLGHLGSELFRAVRLVVDTGIHHKKWSREKAHNYMADNLGWSSYKEIDRYTVWPGQACAYKIGELKILELRKKAGEELGDRFDIKEFHKIILENGSMPLKLLEQQVYDYIS